MNDSPRGRVALLPILARADEAEQAEAFATPPVRVGVGPEQRFVMADGDGLAGSGGRWISSDTVVDPVHRS
jgi:hypothetical protein